MGHGDEHFEFVPPPPWAVELSQGREKGRKKKKVYLLFASKVVWKFAISSSSVGTSDFTVPLFL